MVIVYFHSSFPHFSPLSYIPRYYYLPTYVDDNSSVYSPPSRFSVLVCSSQVHYNFDSSVGTKTVEADLGSVSVLPSVH